MLVLQFKNKTLKTYPVATGKMDTNTPEGQYTIITKLIGDKFEDLGKKLKNPTLLKIRNKKEKIINLRYLNLILDFT